MGQKDVCRRGRKTEAQEAQEMTNFNDQNNVDQQVGMISRNDGENWRAFPNKEAKTV